MTRVDRRAFLQQSGFLVASVAALSVDGVDAFLQTQAAGPYPDLDFRQLDSWIVIRPDNTATFFVGKTDLGQGTGTAFRQIMSDELDIAFENTTCVMGSTDITVDQGGSGGSDALQTDGYPMRRVAAEARRVLLDMASQHFGVPVTALAVSDGAVTAEHKAEGGVEAVEAALPCVVTADLPLGTLRFANLSAVLSARKKPIAPQIGRAHV